MKKLKYWWCFYLEKQDRRQIRVLISGIIVLAGCTQLSGHIINRPKTDFTQFEREASLHLAAMKKARQEENIRPYTAKYNRAPVNLNTADVTDLESLRGIGPVFAARIIKYRNLIGGYLKKEQLLNVYGIDTALYSKIEPYLTVN